MIINRRRVLSVLLPEFNFQFVRRTTVQHKDLLAIRAAENHTRKITSARLIIV